MAVNTGQVHLGGEFADPPENPIPLLRQWFELAVQRGVREPGALALATPAIAHSRPTTNIDSRQLTASENPSVPTNSANNSGIASCVTPPPRLPQPAVVALAVPTQFGANIRDVWYCVMTNDAPIAPISTRNRRNVAKLLASPMPITGSAASKSSRV